MNGENSSTTMGEGLVWTLVSFHKRIASPAEDSWAIIG